MNSSTTDTPLSISGYTTTHNCIDMGYPFIQCLESLLGFCEEVVVVDAGSNDGTIEALRKLSATDARVKVYVEPVDFSHPRWAIHMDGYLKAKARSYCTSKYCWQTDTDEFVAQEDYPKIRILPSILEGYPEYPILFLPMAEFWGSFQRIRADFFTWKQRFSINDKRITHGIPTIHRVLDQAGNEYPRPFDSDSCNYIWADTREEIRSLVPSKVERWDMSAEEYAAHFNQSIEALPTVLHLSWLNLDRKIRHYRKFWPKFHASMYNLEKVDSPERNVMFNKAWAEVTDEDIEKKAQELDALGPRSFHTKMSTDKKGSTMPFLRPIPEKLVKWAEKFLVTPKTTKFTEVVVASAAESEMPNLDIPLSEFIRLHEPLISVVIPTYNKGNFIKESVGSALAQGYKNIEILIVNDGSTDNSAEVAKEIIQSNPNSRIRLLEKTNGGISDTRNFALKHVKGRLVVTLDGDDVMKPGFIIRALQEMRRADVNLVTCEVELFGDETGSWSPNNFDPYYLRYENMIPTLAIWDRNLYDQTSGYNLALAFNEDWAFWLSCSRHGLKVHTIREKLFRYRVTADGLAQNYIKDSWPWSVSLMMTSHEDLYVVDEVLWAHETLKGIPDKWVEKMRATDKLHHSEWLLKLWLGIAAEKCGEIDKAQTLYGQAIQLSGQTNWQPAFRLAALLKSLGVHRQAADLFHYVRVIRPDMNRFVKEPIDWYSGQVKAGTLST